MSLRTMLVIVTLLCCCLAYETYVVRTRGALRRQAQSQGTFHFTTSRDWSKTFPAGSLTGEQPARIPWQRQLLGDEAIQEIWFHPQGGDEFQTNLAALKRHFPEARFIEALYEPCHPGCFPVGTRVATPLGDRAIESIELGDVVVALLPGGDRSASTVRSIFTTHNRLLLVSTANQQLCTTATQPLARAPNDIVAAGELKSGDRLLVVNDQGNVVSEEVVSVATTDRYESVINLVLGDSELFIAGGFVARSKPPRIPSLPAD
jgi:hypothetical protein